MVIPAAAGRHTGEFNLDGTRYTLSFKVGGAAASAGFVELALGGYLLYFSGEDHGRGGI